MPQYHVTLTDEEQTELQELVEKGIGLNMPRFCLNWMNVQKTTIGHMIVLEKLITHPVVQLQEWQNAL